ncbi:hypothetical protein FOCC_FOCC014275 [Frankliniella occidentalis]|nr:hypothetical protein FOCC_FOCC014275 [Frankliniella occidentalis]
MNEAEAEMDEEFESETEVNSENDRSSPCPQEAASSPVKEVPSSPLIYYSSDDEQNVLPFSPNKRKCYEFNEPSKDGSEHQLGSKVSSTDDNSVTECNLTPPPEGPSENLHSARGGEVGLLHAVNTEIDQILTSSSSEESSSSSSSDEDSTSSSSEECVSESEYASSDDECDISAGNAKVFDGCLLSVDEGEEESKCPLKGCGKDSHKFYQLSIAAQIKNFFENHGLADEIDKYSATRAANCTPGVSSDLLDGSEVVRCKIGGQYDIILIGHTDGVSISKSSSCSLWPSEFVIGNVSPHSRYKFVIVSGIWVDSCKPYMNTFMKPFVRELAQIREHGVHWTHPRTKLECATRVKVPGFIVDAPVRAQLQNILGVGGKHCCNVCEEKTKRLPAETNDVGEKQKRKRVFMYEEEPCLRSAARMKIQEKETKKLEQQKKGKVDPVKGVKGYTVISDLPGCDVGTAVFPEYMHLLLCFVKHMFSIWFETAGPWSLRQFRDRIDLFLASVRVPDFVTRIPRSTECYAQWKANELRTFVLYLSLVILSQFMKPVYLQHWMLFVCALNLLLQEQISETDIARADIMLQMFVADFHTLYKSELSTYYLHNVRHLALVVKRFGPLWCNSAFQLESFNGSLRQFIHGTKNQGQELINNVKLACGVQILRLRVATNSALHQSNVTLRNQIQGFKFNEKEILSIEPLQLKKPIRVFYRAVFGKTVYTSYIYTRQKRRNNFTVCFTNTPGAKDFGMVKCFLEDSENVKAAIVKKFSVEHTRVFCHDRTNTLISHVIPINETKEFVAVPIKNILYKVLRAGDFVCCRPNSYEVNL